MEERNPLPARSPTPKCKNHGSRKSRSLPVSPRWRRNSAIACQRFDSEVNTAYKSSPTALEPKAEQPATTTSSTTTKTKKIPQAVGYVQDQTPTDQNNSEPSCNGWSSHLEHNQEHEEEDNCVLCMYYTIQCCECPSECLIS